MWLEALNSGEIHPMSETFIVSIFNFGLSKWLGSDLMIILGTLEISGLKNDGSRNLLLFDLKPLIVVELVVYDFKHFRSVPRES